MATNEQSIIELYGKDKDGNEIKRYLPSKIELVPGLKGELLSGKAYKETSSSQTTRTVTIEGVTSYDDILNKPIFIKAATYGTNSAATLNVNSLGTKSLYFPTVDSSSITTTPPYYWVRTSGVYCVVWDGSYMHVCNPQARSATGSYAGLVKLSGNPATADFAKTFKAAASVTSFNSTTYLYHQEMAISFTGAATGAPSGLTSGTTYYGILINDNYSVTSYSTTYGVRQTLIIPKYRKTYQRYAYVDSTSDYPAWEDISDTVNVAKQAYELADGKENAITAGAETQYFTGAKNWHDFASDVRAVVLTGLSTATNAAIAAGDSILTALGKLQAQITNHTHPAQTSVSGNAGTATTLANSRTIDGMSFNGSANITHYGSCSTAAGTVAKAVTLSGFTLAAGAMVTVKFTVANTAANPTLNVNSTGAKAVYYKGTNIRADYLKANGVYTFVYNGTQYELIGDGFDTPRVTIGTVEPAEASVGDIWIDTNNN